MKRVLMIIGTMVALRVLGAPITSEVAVGRGLEWMAGNPVMGIAAGRPVASVEVFPNIGGYSVCVVSLDPIGYLVLNSDDRLPLVVCFSAESGANLSDMPENAFRDMLLNHVERMAKLLEEPDALKPMAELVKPLAVTELFGPFLETTWNQCNPYNKLCPDDPEGSDYYAQRAPVGCVPTAYAQLLAFHRWPVFGEGARSYTDSSGSITGPHSAVFSDAYDWGSMQPAYSAFGVNPLAAEDAVAELMYELGVAAEANYEHAGTSASTSTLGQRLDDYFFFEPCEWRSTRSALIAPMEADLRAGFPCVVSIPGHAIVADGLMVDDGTTTYHFNYGWGGTNNGWWDASSIPGGALQYGITSLRPCLMAFPKTNTVDGVACGSIELSWILPKRREPEVAQLNIHYFDQQTGTWPLWQSFAKGTSLTSRRFSAVETLWDDCADFSEFELTSGGSSYSGDWVVNTTSGVGNCFYKKVPEYIGGLYHLTSISTITPTLSTRLLLRAKYKLASDQFRVLLSVDRSSFTEVWSGNGSIDWSDILIDLAAYAGQEVYVRLEYEGGGYYLDGGVWVDSVSTQEVTNPELEGQPIYYTTLFGLETGTYRLAATLTGTDAVVHDLAPEFTLTVPFIDGDGDGMPTCWEEQYGLDPEVDDAGLDPDNDGYSNLEEYICGTIPTHTASAWGLEAGPGGLPSFDTLEQRLYTIEYSSNLSSNIWLPVSSGISEWSGRIDVDDYDSATNAARFYRVHVQQAD